MHCLLQVKWGTDESGRLVASEVLQVANEPPKAAPSNTLAVALPDNGGTLFVPLGEPYVQDPRNGKRYQVRSLRNG